MNSLEPGTRLTPFLHITRDVARGGMGAVYAARDTRHGRDVAVKVLDRGSAAGIGRDRFEREIAVLARLTHPNILPLFDSGEHDGLLYYVMPLAVGASLRDRLRVASPLAVDEVLRIAHDVADALDYAHAEGVVHRDIKPENILLLGGRAVVADFGVARWRTLAAPTLTATGLTVGTPAYMSPEQASADIADARSDVYSLGCVVFEMLTGETPYVAATPGELIAQHLVAPVPSLRARRATIAAAYDVAVARALAKAPADRFATAGRFVSELRGLRPTPEPGDDDGVRTVLVLPFANASGDPDLEYFADGLTDELITLLGTVRAFKVISRTSAMRLKGTTRSLSEIARDVQVRFVVEGTARRQGQAIRVTARLVDTRDDAAVWSERIDGALDDVFAVQERIATRIADALRVALTPQERERLARRPLVSTEVYDYFLRAKQESMALTPAAYASAMRLLDRALDLNGPSELLYGAKGVVTVWAFDSGCVTDERVLDDVLTWAEAAFALDADSVMALTAAGGATFKRGALLRSVRHLRRALDIDPGNPDATAWLSMAFSAGGLHGDAAMLARRAADVDPLTPVVQCFPGAIDWVRGDPRAARPAYQRWYSMDPRSAYARVCLGSIDLCLGDLTSARALCTSVLHDPDAGVWAAPAALFLAAIDRDAEQGRHRDRRRRARVPPRFAGVRRLDRAWLGPARRRDPHDRMA
jgi:serine/threonine-protein kinase